MVQGVCSLAAGYDLGSVGTSFSLVNFSKATKPITPNTTKINATIAKNVFVFFFLLFLLEGALWLFCTLLLGVGDC